MKYLNDNYFIFSYYGTYVLISKTIQENIRKKIISYMNKKDFYGDMPEQIHRILAKKFDVQIEIDKWSIKFL